jgi:hypothetical protein
MISRRGGHAHGPAPYAHQAAGDMVKLKGLSDAIFQVFCVLMDGLGRKWAFSVNTTDVLSCFRSFRMKKAIFFTLFPPHPGKTIRQNGRRRRNQAF